MYTSCHRNFSNVILISLFTDELLAEKSEIFEKFFEHLPFDTSFQSWLAFRLNFSNNSKINSTVRRTRLLIVPVRWIPVINIVIVYVYCLWFCDNVLSNSLSFKSIFDCFKTVFSFCFNRFRLFARKQMSVVMFWREKDCCHSRICYIEWELDLKYN